MKDKFNEKIFSKIEEGEIKPLPESYFENQSRAIWTLVSVLVLLSVIAGCFLINDSAEFLWASWYSWWYSNYMVVPNLFWLSIVALLLIVWMLSLRNTPMWYKNSYIKNFLMISWIALIWSFAFNWSGIWPMMHSYFINNVPWISNTVYNDSSWTDPKSWRLAWTIKDLGQNDIKIIWTDSNTWTIKLDKAFISPMVSVVKWERIRIYWNQSWDREFQAESVMPIFWMGMWMWWGYWQGNSNYGRWWDWCD